MKTAIQIKTDGTIAELDLSADSLATLQKAVGGLVQAIDLGEFTMWCNDEGKMLSLPHNPYGQAFWTVAYGNTDYIVGDIVLTGGADSEGETLGLTAHQAYRVRTVAQAVSELVGPRVTVY
jgi:hypothetical protein